MKNGIKDRDELRTLPIEKQKELQKMAAEDISNMKDDVILIDTHAFISTKSGFYPGLPNYVIQIIQPSNFIAITASPDEIHDRRMKDKTRSRDPISIEDIKKEAQGAKESGATEIHIVGGLHPWLPFTYYTDAIRAIREVAPNIHIKAFTAVEIVHLAKISKRGKDGNAGIASVINELVDVGLGSLPGGGAEIGRAHV